ncbi:polysaccharide deacetylase family protein [Clostridium sp. CTA-5]
MLKQIHQFLYLVKNKTKQICFTFDSGFEDNETLDILNVLKRHNIKSTFF